ncbi:MarR family transcriptional regulator [Nibricoccus aquaticus]|uniref:MarR family transcriptional regulator n=1 Tax=Nibricoccus aquaticus TaxID=2576891 RepID=A0A290QI39_9BACT|nr:MarR family transcriptional regulator [Nibricoccus aquaticus]ATC63542.1 MarR family transcriptional regulator [Nibricoccus aquaticus]
MPKAAVQTSSVRAFSKADYEKLAAWRYSLRRFLRFSEEATSEAGVTPQQHQALLAVQGMPGREELTVGELAERLQLRHHSTVELVDRLETAGLMKRAVSAEDGRQVLLTVTAKGLRLLEKLTAVHRAELKRVGPELAAVLSAVVTAAQEEGA